MTASDKNTAAAQRITELESALQEIVRVATQPISSMRPIKHQLQERGQEMLDIARLALDLRLALRAHI